MIFLFGSNLWVVESTEDNIYFSPEKIPANDVALVLGTSKYSRSGRSNLFFKYRIEAAVKLYKAGKVKHFILSGDSSAYYNEPKDMKKALLAYGIPVSAITLDKFGLRTFDSVVRSKKVFQQRRLTIITQEFHSYRALFISRYYGIDAVAFTTEQVPKAFSLTTLTREYFARCKAIVDLYLLNKEPKFLGEEIDINIE
ncbi:MAG: YdcF family protein [Cytophagaceae bacterium]|nr:YdcF family protein [Cytophagaceae bacterium]